MTIEDPDKFCKGLWDWAVLDGCFGQSRIRPTDIDGLVEHKGKFILYETKASSVPVKQGQRIMLERFASRSDFTVVIVWGYPGKPEKMQVGVKAGWFLFDTTNLKELRDLCSAWYRGAERNTLPESLSIFLLGLKEAGRCR